MSATALSGPTKLELAFLSPCLLSVLLETFIVKGEDDPAMGKDAETMERQ